MPKYVIAIDVGTTGTRAIAFSKNIEIITKSYYELKQFYPNPLWVEQDPIEIYKQTLKALKDVIDTVGIENVECIGITNQRETTILWDKETAEPVYNAISWQCKRSQRICEELQEYKDLIKQRTGLPLNPYFSATKIKWVLDNIETAKIKYKQNKLLFGTVDSWILYNLTKGKSHLTEYSNASRTLCFNIHTLQYDKDLLNIFNLKEEIFPEIKQSSDFFGYLDKSFFNKEIPITGILGDQQASLLANIGFNSENIKNTYGTGLFILSLIDIPIIHENLITTIAWKINNKIQYALEGSIFAGGNIIKYVRDQLKLIKSAPETEDIAKSLESNEGVYFIPALSGLSAPYWNSNAKAIILGLTYKSDYRYIVRAALEAIAYQTKDLIEIFKNTLNKDFKELYVDGGASSNNFLMQFQADLLNMKIIRPSIIETTALGAALAAALYTNFWDINYFFANKKIDKIFYPSNNKNLVQQYYQTWKKAIKFTNEFYSDYP